MILFLSVCITLLLFALLMMNVDKFVHVSNLYKMSNGVSLGVVGILTIIRSWKFPATPRKQLHPPKGFKIWQHLQSYERKPSSVFASASLWVGKFPSPFDFWLSCLYIPSTNNQSNCVYRNYNRKRAVDHLQRRL